MTRKLHLREAITAEAKIEFLKFINDWLNKHDLTSIEFQQILLDQMQSSLKYALRLERHGNDDTPAGLEG